MTSQALPTYPEHIESTMAFRAIKQLEQAGIMAPSDRVLVVFGGDFDATLFSMLGYDAVEISSIDYGEFSTEGDQRLDATRLPYPSDSFDHVFAHAGIHHASRPHQALCEMYRVAGRSTLFFEAQDSLVMRALARFGLVSAYEWNAIVYSEFKRGGVDDTPIPNHVLRWTQREVEKVIRSLDPAHIPRIHYFREWGIYYERFATRLAGTPVGRLPAPLVRTAVNGLGRLANRVAGAQGNLFGVCIEKHGAGFQRWIKEKDGVAVFDRATQRHQIRTKPGK